MSLSDILSIMQGASSGGRKSGEFQFDGKPAATFTMIDQTLIMLIEIVPAKFGLSSSFLFDAKNAFLKAKSQQACIKCTDVTKSSLHDRYSPFSVINKFHTNSNTFSGVHGNVLKKSLSFNHLVSSTDLLLFSAAIVFTLF